MNINISEKIKLLRLASNMTQGDLAKALNVTISSVSAYELGTRTPSPDIIIKLAQQFHVTTDNLFGLSNNYSVDVSELTASQRNVVNEIIESFVMKNKITNWGELAYERMTEKNFFIERE